MIRRSRQFSLSPREECCDGGHGCKLMLTLCREPKKSRLNAAGYLVFCLLVRVRIPAEAPIVKVS